MKNIIKAFVFLLLFSLCMSCVAPDYTRKSPTDCEYNQRLRMNMYWYQWQNYPHKR